MGNRERAVWSRTRLRGGRLGATVAITAILFHRLSFIKPDKLLKELLSDCCWYAARKQPSVSVSESITLLSCAREEEGGSTVRQIRATNSCSDGGSSRWQSWLPSHEQPKGWSVVYQPFSTIITTRVELDQTLLLHEFCWSVSSGSSPWYWDNENVTPGCCFIHCWTRRAKVSGIN